MFRQSKGGLTSKEDKQTIGIHISGATLDTDTFGTNYFDIDTERINNGERTLVENTAKIDENPQKRENWDCRQNEGTTVWDEKNPESYVYIGGKWRNT